MKHIEIVKGRCWITTIALTRQMQQNEHVYGARNGGCNNNNRHEETRMHTS
jgi:hypothetical protein